MADFGHSRAHGRSLVGYPARVIRCAFITALVICQIAEVSAQDAGTDAGSVPSDAGVPDAAVDPNVVTPPKLLEFVEAPYPEALKAEGKSAEVVLGLTIQSDGSVSEVVVVHSSGEKLFDDAAVQAAKQFAFEPATRGGKPIAARIQFKYVFELKEEKTVAPPTPELLPAALGGEVLDAEDQTPIQNAEVFLTREGLSKRAETDAAGTFRFEGLEPGQYQLRFYRDGYREQTSTEELASGEDKTLRFQLLRIEEVLGFGATAVIDPPRREVVRRTVRREELTRIAGTRGDALRTIELLPGVGRPAFGAGQIIIRGAAPGDSEAYLDGSPVPLLYHFGGLTSFINSRLLQQIDFYPGNFSARFGRRMGGIIDVSLREPSVEKLKGVVDVNVIDASVLVEAPLSDGEGANVGSIAMGARRSYIDFVFAEAVPDDVFDVVAAPVYWDYQLVTSWKPSDNDKVLFAWYGSSDRFEIIFNDPPSDDPFITGNFDLSTQFHRGQLSWKHLFPELKLEQTAMFSAGPTTLGFSAGPQIRFTLDTINYYVRNEWTWRPEEYLTLIGGLDIFIAPTTVNFSGPPPDQGEGAPDTGRTIAQRGFVTVSDKASAYRPAAYVESILVPHEAVELTVGARLDWYRDIESWSLNPRMSGLVNLSETFRIKGGVGLFSQPPQFQESAPGLGNPDLVPEQALHVGLGGEVDIDDGIRVGVDGFYKNLWDLVVGTQNGVPPRFENEGVGNIFGVEVSGRIEPRKNRPFFGFLSYTLSRSERRDHPGDPWRLFDFDQTHILALAGTVLLGDGWEAGAAFRLISGNPYTPIQSGIYDANYGVYRPVYGSINSERSGLFHRLDLRVEKKWEFEDWNLALYLDVQNVYNRMNPEGIIYNYDFSESAVLPGLPIIPSLGIRGELP